MLALQNIVEILCSFLKYKQGLFCALLQGERGTYGAKVKETKRLDMLVGYIDATIDEADNFLMPLQIDIQGIIDDHSIFDRLDAYRKAYNKIVENDDNKEQFKVILNVLMNLYDASKPEIFEKNWHNEKFAPLAYLFGLFHNTIDDEKINRARLRMAQLLDTSVTSDVAMDDPNSKFAIHGTKIIDLSKIDIDGIRAEIKTAEYKAVEIDDLKDFIEQALQRMLNRNCTRNKFSQRYKSIIDRYNAGGSENEDYYEQLLQLIEDLKKEESRAETEGLTEEELEMYDLLIAGKKLTKAEEQKVKLAAKNLFKKLSENKKSLLVVDWYKDDMPREKVKDAITTSLDADLPESYDKESFQAKISLLLNHFMDMAIQGYGWIANVA